MRPRRNAVSIITLISIIGVMLGVAVLVIVLLVMTGFINLTEKKILDTQSHAQISRQYAMTDYQDVVDFIDKLGGSTAPVINAPVLMQIKNRFDPKVLLAVTPEDVAKHYKITPPSSNKQIIDPAQTTANPEDAQSILIDGSFDLNRGDVVISRHGSSCKSATKFFYIQPNAFPTWLRWRPTGVSNCKIRMKSCCPMNLPWREFIIWANMILIPP